MEVTLNFPLTVIKSVCLACIQDIALAKALLPASPAAAAAFSFGNSKFQTASKTETTERGKSFNLLLFGSFLRREDLLKEVLQKIEF